MGMGFWYVGVYIAVSYLGKLASSTCADLRSRERIQVFEEVFLIWEQEFRQTPRV